MAMTDIMRRGQESKNAEQKNAGRKSNNKKINLSAAA